MKACDTKVELKQDHRGVVFHIQDDLDFFAAPRVREIVMAAIERHPSHNIELDLVQVDHVDSAGLGVIAALLKSPKFSGQLSAVVAEGSQPQRILRQSMFDTIFRVTAVDPELQE